MERSRTKKSYNNSRFTAAADSTTFFRILCPSSHLTAVTANINSVRRDTGSRIDVHRLIPGDDDRIIETSNILHRGPDGRVSHYSAARKALLLIHALILKSESDDDGGSGWGKDRRWAGRVTRLVVSKNNIGCLLGVGGKIMEQMRRETNTHIRIMDRDQSTPRCVSATEEIVRGVDDDDLFPAQEALLHIQNQIVDLGPDGDNIITTKLLIPNFEVGCLEGINDSLSEIQKLTSANVHIVPKELLPTGVFQDDEIIQIVGEIRAARSALVRLTTKLQSSIYRDISKPMDMLTSSVPASGHVGHATAVESNSPIRSLPDKGHRAGNTAYTAYRNMHTAGVAWQPKDTGACAIGSLEQEKSNVKDDSKQSDQSRITTPFVAKRTLEIIIPKRTVPNLLIGSRSKLALISEISGAMVCLINVQPEQSEKIVEVSGSPEKVERAHSLLQGFILSTQDVIPSSLSLGTC